MPAFQICLSLPRLRFCWGVCLMLIAAVLASSTASAATKPRLLVLPVQVPRGSTVESLQGALSDTVTAALQESGQYSVVGSSDINAAIAVERQKDLLGCDSTTCMAELAGALAADKMVTVNIARAGNAWVVTARLVSSKGDIVVDATSVDTIIGEGTALIRAIPGVISKLLSGGGVSQRTIVMPDDSAGKGPFSLADRRRPTLQASNDDPYSTVCLSPLSDLAATPPRIDWEYGRVCDLLRQSRDDLSQKARVMDSGLDAMPLCDAWGIEATQRAAETYYALALTTYAAPPPKAPARVPASTPSKPKVIQGTESVEEARRRYREEKAKQTDGNQTSQWTETGVDGLRRARRLLIRYLEGPGIYECPGITGDNRVAIDIEMLSIKVHMLMGSLNSGHLGTVHRFISESVGGANLKALSWLVIAASFDRAKDYQKAARAYEQPAEIQGASASVRAMALYLAAYGNAQGRNAERSVERLNQLSALLKKEESAIHPSLGPVLSTSAYGLFEYARNR